MSTEPEIELIESFLKFCESRNMVNPERYEIEEFLKHREHEQASLAAQAQLASHIEDIHDAPERVDVVLELDLPQATWLINIIQDWRNEDPTYLSVTEDSHPFQVSSGAG